jgi:hypothetical protein
MLQQSLKATLPGTETIGPFVRIKRVNSFKENKDDVVGWLTR